MTPVRRPFRTIPVMALLVLALAAVALGAARGSRVRGRHASGSAPPRRRNAGRTSSPNPVSTLTGLPGRPNTCRLAPIVA